MARHSMTDHYDKFSLQPETLTRRQRNIGRSKNKYTMIWYNQGSGIKPTSHTSPWIKVARLSDGEGEARRKAGLMEYSESLLLLLLNGGQGAAVCWRSCCREQPAVAEGSGQGAANLETSRLGGVVFVLPGGHKSPKSKEWATLSSMSLVLCVHYVNRKQKQVKKQGKISLLSMSNR